MKLLFELSKEHPTLPLSELTSCLDSEAFAYSVLDVIDRFLYVDISIENHAEVKRIGERVSMCHSINEVLFLSMPSLESLLQPLKTIDLGEVQSFKVKCENHQRPKIVKSVDIERKVGAILAQSHKVNLSNPDVEIRIILTNECWFVCKKIMQIDRSQYESRKAKYRPFFSPISMHPRLARAMVNLSKIKKGETLLDPFCGTGGILIEAGLIGVRVIGSDIERKMVEGCIQNLTFYDIKGFEVFQSDISEIPSLVEKVDSIATDFPYGKSATTKKESIDKLYPRAFEAMSEVLKPKRRLVATLPSIDAIKWGSEFLDLVEIHPFRVHRSLTRYISVYTKP